MKKSNFDCLSGIIGNTPLVKISDRIYAKLETYNPSGSVKDRMISFIINEAIKGQEIQQDTVLCDATSGNTGISLSMISASLGLKCVIFMPSNMSIERRKMMEIYGAEIIESRPNDFEHAIQMRNDFLSSNSKAWSPCQFSNPKNIECHFLTTAPEIHKNVSDLNLKWGVFIHGSGTGGTIEGIRRYVTANRMTTKVVMSQPYESPHGIQGIADGREFLALDSDMDGIVKVKTSDAAKKSKELAKTTGLLVGISSGANLIACEDWLKQNPSEGVAITILCDRGERYLSIF